MQELSVKLYQWIKIMKQNISTKNLTITDDNSYFNLNKYN